MCDILFTDSYLACYLKLRDYVSGNNTNYAMTLAYVKYIISIVAAILCLTMGAYYIEFICSWSNKTDRKELTNVPYYIWQIIQILIYLGFITIIVA